LSTGCATRCETEATDAATPDRPVDPEQWASTIEAELREAGNPERAAGTRAYLKSDLEFLGTSVPDIRRVLATSRARHPRVAPADVVTAADALWSVPVFERRLAAVEMLHLYVDGLGPDDMVVVERLLREARTWALVDPLAVKVVGALVVAHPELGSTLDRWVEDDDFWIRRSALLALLTPLRRGEGDPDRFLGYADRLLDERQFFIRKAIGWVLRDVSRRRPELVRDWLATRTHRVSGVTIREAVKHLAAADRERLLLAYRERRSAPRAP
jgi:3-methyladenine DNA glycosylase AlkD